MMETGKDLFCPICNTPYIKHQDQICKECLWTLLFEENQIMILGEDFDIMQFTYKHAKGRFKELYEKYLSDLSSITTELDDFKNEITSIQEYSPKKVEDLLNELESQNANTLENIIEGVEQRLRKMQDFQGRETLENRIKDISLEIELRKSNTEIIRLHKELNGERNLKEKFERDFFSLNGTILRSTLPDGYPSEA